jgi:hypothetical protein
VAKPLTVLCTVYMIDGKTRYRLARYQLKMPLQASVFASWYDRDTESLTGKTEYALTK